MGVHVRGFNDEHLKHIFILCCGINFTEISWTYATNITDYNEEQEKEYQKIYDALNLRLGKEAKTFDLDKITDPILKRKLESISKIGTSILEGDDLDNYVDVTSKLAKIYC